MSSNVKRVQRYDIKAWNSVTGIDETRNRDLHYEPDLKPCKGLTLAEVKLYVERYIEGMYLSLITMGEDPERLTPLNRFAVEPLDSDAKNVIFVIEEMNGVTAFSPIPLMRASCGANELWGLVAYDSVD